MRAAGLLATSAAASLLLMAYVTLRYSAAPGPPWASRPAGHQLNHLQDRPHCAPSLAATLIGGNPLANDHTTQQDAVQVCSSACQPVCTGPPGSVHCMLLGTSAWHSVTFSAEARSRITHTRVRQGGGDPDCTDSKICIHQCHSKCNTGMGIHATHTCQACTANTCTQDHADVRIQCQRAYIPQLQ